MFVSTQTTKEMDLDELIDDDIIYDDDRPEYALQRLSGNKVIQKQQYI